jgi:peptide/nickel transport system permease protein
MPGDPVKLALGSEKAADPEIVAAMEKQLGLDQPLLKQYTTYMSDLAHFHLGTSITDRSSVMENIMLRLPRTIEIALVSIIIASIVGIIMGLIAALKWRTFTDFFMTAMAALGISLPVFVMGTLLIVIFSLTLNWFPASGYIDFVKDPIKHIQRLILPSLALALGLAASITRMTRSSMLEVESKEFVQTLRAKGLPERMVIFKHSFRNAIIPIITIIGLQLGSLIGGTVLVEYLFNWPGISTLLVKAVSYRDYPTVQGCILVISVFFITVNTLVDILYGLLDPRVR